VKLTKPCYTGFIHPIVKSNAPLKPFLKNVIFQLLIICFFFFENEVRIYHKSYLKIILGIYKHTSGGRKMKNSKERNKMIAALADTNQHYKLYKSGKKWLLMGLTTLTFGVLGITTNASAATTPTVTTAPAATTSDQSAASTTSSAAATNDTPAVTTAATSATNETPATTTNAVSATPDSAVPATSSTAATPTADAATTTPATTALGAASATEVAAAKTNAATVAAKTGQPQTVTAAAAVTVPTDASDTTTELASLSQYVQQAMTDNGVTYDSERANSTGNNYYFFGTYDYLGPTKLTGAALSANAAAFANMAVDKINAEVQVNTYQNQLLQSLAQQGITVSVLVQPNFSKVDMSMILGNFENPGYSGTPIPSDYQSVAPATQTVTFINDATGKTIKILTLPANEDGTQQVAAMTQQLTEAGFISVSNNYQAPAATEMTVTEALAAVQTQLQTIITAYNAANGTDYELNQDYLRPVENDQPYIDHMFLLTSEQLGHEAWDASIQQKISKTAASYSDVFGREPAALVDGVVTSNIGSNLNLNDAILNAGYTSDYMYVDWSDYSTFNTDSDEYQAAFSKAAADTTPIYNQLINDPTLTQALEVLRSHNEIVSVNAAPFYKDSNFTYDIQAEVYTTTTDANGTLWHDTGTSQTVQQTLAITGISDYLLKQLFTGTELPIAQAGPNTDYEAHFTEARLGDGIHIFTKTQVPDAVSVTPSDYYDFTKPGQVGDGIHVFTKVQVPDAVSVTPSDYYDFTKQGQVGDGIHVFTKVQVPDAVSVTPKDYYDNTQQGQVGDGIHVFTKV
jgi:hypothetical protein